MKDDHIMKHDAIYVGFLAIMMLILGILGSSLAFHG